MDGRDRWVASHCHLPTNWPNSTAWRASKAANQKPCQQSPASTLIFLPPHLPPLSLHPAMCPELSQLCCHSRAVTDPWDWHRWQAVTQTGSEALVVGSSPRPIGCALRSLVGLCSPRPSPGGRKTGRCVKLCALLWHFVFL